MSTAASTPAARPKPGRYDAAERKQSKRNQREKGCWVYIAQDELLAAGFEPGDPPSYYRARGRQRSANARAVVIDLYREP